MSRKKRRGQAPEVEASAEVEAPTAPGVKHPEITVTLSGVDGNAYTIIGRVKRAMLRAGLAESEISSYVHEAQSGTYDQLLASTMRWVNVE